MSSVITWSDMGASLGNTAQMTALVLAIASADCATSYLFRKAYDCFDEPYIDIGRGVAVNGQIAERNERIMMISAAVIAVILPNYLPLKLKSFDLEKNLDLVQLDLITYLVMRVAYKGNRFVKSQGFLFLLLSRPITHLACIALGDRMKCIVSAIFAVCIFLCRNSHRERRLGVPHPENTLSGRVHTLCRDIVRWSNEPVDLRPRSYS